ncbi:SGNH/GDSL hydrolase family protein [Acetivibrio straminisolvens]|uniref:SGNH/GDSL hydrolase family protein n=1 Tax=Acetivibrio straminisolvens TaxID=253314 RepID=UPI002354A487|nr:SGNH/GDSL hydrolase family protein [Acetivibrio straminisolvens]
MWKNAIYLFCSIFIVSAIILISGKYLDDTSAKSTVEQSKSLEDQVGEYTELEKAQSRNVYAKLMNNKEINVLIIGDGIVQGGPETDGNKKWYNLLAKRIKEEYGADSTFKVIATPGGTAFGGWIDYLTDSSAQEYELVFLCFGASDEKELKFNQTIFGNILEGLIRNIKKTKANTEIITIIENSIKSEAYINTLKKVSDYYDITYVDTIKAFINSRQGIDVLTEDGVNPSEKGYSIYIDAVFDLIKSNIDNKREPGFDERKPLLFEESNRFYTAKITTEFLTIGGFYNSVVACDKIFMKSNRSNDYITYEVKDSQVLGVTLLGGPDCGIVDIYLNDKLIQTYDCYAPYEALRHVLISDNIGVGTHKIRIEVSSIKNAKASDSNVYIHGLITN